MLLEVRDAPRRRDHAEVVDQQREGILRDLARARALPATRSRDSFKGFRGVKRPPNVKDMTHVFIIKGTEPPSVVPTSPTKG